MSGKLSKEIEGRSGMVVSLIPRWLNGGLEPVYHVTVRGAGGELISEDKYSTYSEAERRYREISEGNLLF